MSDRMKRWIWAALTIIGMTGCNLADDDFGLANCEDRAKSSSIDRVVVDAIRRELSHAPADAGVALADAIWADQFVSVEYAGRCANLPLFDLVRATRVCGFPGGTCYLGGFDLVLTVMDAHVVEDSIEIVLLRTTSDPAAVQEVVHYFKGEEPIWVARRIIWET